MDVLGAIGEFLSQVLEEDVEVDDLVSFLVRFVGGWGFQTGFEFEEVGSVRELGEEKVVEEETWVRGGVPLVKEERLGQEMPRRESLNFRGDYIVIII